jgi:hypothetical protein
MDPHEGEAERMTRMDKWLKLQRYQRMKMTIMIMILLKAIMTPSPRLEMSTKNEELEDITNDAEARNYFLRKDSLIE